MITINDDLTVRNDVGMIVGKVIGCGAYDTGGGEFPAAIVYRIGVPAELLHAPISTLTLPNTTIPPIGERNIKV